MTIKKTALICLMFMPLSLMAARPLYLPQWGKEKGTSYPYVPTYAQDMEELPVTAFNELAPDEFKHSAPEILYTTFGDACASSPESAYYFYNNTPGKVVIIFRNSNRKAAPSGFKMAVAPRGLLCLGGLIPPARLEILDMENENKPFGYVELSPTYHFYVWQGNGINAYTPQ